MKVKFRSFYCRCPLVASSISIEEVPIYSQSEDGDVVVSGYRNISKYIDSFRDDVDIGFIMQRVLSGDIDALSKARSFYADVTGLPSSLLEAHQASSSFDDLVSAFPSDVLAKIKGCKDDDALTNVLVEHFRTISNKETNENV